MSIKTALYWTVTDNKIARYEYENPVEEIKEILSKFPSFQDRHVVVYRLDVLISLDDIMLMLNGKFNHCMFPNYMDAELIFDSTKQEDLSTIINI
jgi:hypothetical protein